MTTPNYPNKLAPLTFDLEEALLNKMRDFQKKASAQSISAIIRYAIEQFNFDSHHIEHQKHTQISVRLPEDLRKKLSQFSKQKNVSIGELIRLAVTKLCSQKPKPQTIKAMTTKTVKKKAVVKKKAPAKKTAAKKVAKKAPVKKVVAKKKPAVKKSAVKKVITKKTPAKKVAVKKVAKKVAAPKKTTTKKPLARKTATAKK